MTNLETKSYKATIGFWLVQEDKLQVVCPSIIADKRINTMEHLPVTNVWNAQVITREEFTENAIITLIPTILTVSKLDKDINSYESILDIDIIQEKIKELTSKYVKTSSL